MEYNLSMQSAAWGQPRNQRHGVLSHYFARSLWLLLLGFVVLELGFFVDTGTKTKEVFLVTKNFKFFNGMIYFRFLKGNKINFVLAHYFHNLLTFTRFV